MGYLSICSDIILRVSQRVFGNELVNGVEQLALPEVGAHGSPSPGSRHKTDVDYIV